MSDVLYSSIWKRLACALALAGGIFLGLIVPATPSHATAVPKQCTLNQTLIRAYYSDAAHLHPVCTDVIGPAPCQTHYCDPTPYYTDSCGSTCLL